jgi:ring-1,2-phenylacetyl-CoA epoxidase subunit PaaB
MTSQDFIHSLDPRVNRLQLPTEVTTLHNPDANGGQLATYEVFQQMKAGKPYEHTGIVHASDADMAFLFGKEQFSRRGGMCESMFVLPSASIHTSAYTEGAANALDPFKEYAEESSEQVVAWDVFYLKKRGKQHYYAGRVEAATPALAMKAAAETLYATPCLNVWVALASEVQFADSEDKDIWLTLPEKKYRDAIAYKSQDKIDRYKKESAAS